MTHFIQLPGLDNVEVFISDGFIGRRDWGATVWIDGEQVPDIIGWGHTPLRALKHLLEYHLCKIEQAVVRAKEKQNARKVLANVVSDAPKRGEQD